MEIKEVELIKVWQMRKEIMYPNGPPEMIQLPVDKDGLHLGLFNKNELISIISLFIKNEEMQFRKFATQINYQGKGYGTKLLLHVFEIAKERGLNRIYCNARKSVTGLYLKFGMQQFGEAYIQHGIEFIKMEKQLN